ncbi:MAG: ABC transporter permease [Acidobacteria bacterium]|nr:ABC transporter permease [Acidobacteriota bacterium]
MGTWMGDLRVSLRQLAKAPGFTVAAIMVLALGIGLNAVMFSLVYAVGFMGRPYDRPEPLVQLYSSQTREPDSYRAFSYPAYREIQTHADLFEGVLAHNPTLVGVGEGANTRRTFAVVVSRNYFEVLGAPIVHGRGFTEDESVPGRDIPVVVATYGFWQRTGFDPALVGGTLRINERDYTVVGITAQGFTGTMMVFGPELFFPLGVFHVVSNDFQGQEQRTLNRADAYNLFLAARLKKGITEAAAARRLEPIGPHLERAFPAEYKDARVTLAALPRLGTSTSPSDERPIAVLGGVMLGLTGAVLLTVCLNLAAMLLARGRARRKEFAIRLALGGGRMRIVRQLLTEGLVLSLAGGALGVVLGLYGIDVLIGAVTSRLPIAIVLEGAVSPALVAATGLFCLLATAWFALGPALRHSRADVVADLKPQAGEDAYGRRRRFLPRHPLVVAQVSLSLALLIAAGLFVRMAQSALSMDFGYRADDTVLAEVDGALAGYTAAQTRDLYARVEQRLASIPGVESAGVGALVPLGMVNMSQSVKRAGLSPPEGARPQTAEEGRAFGTPWNAVSSSYFAAMGVLLLQGRTFTEGESYGEGAPPVAILDETLARRLWPDGHALGQRVTFESRADPPVAPEPIYQVVGIVASTHRQLFEKEFPGAVYVPFGQGAMGNAYFHVRPIVPSSILADLVRREIKEIAPGLPVFTARTFAQHIRSSAEYWMLRLSAVLFSVFGVLAVVVALVGIYGVMSYTVARRTREIGIRMAVGARPGAVRWMILGESTATTLLGVGIGWLLGLAVGRLLASIFVDVSAFDVATFSALPLGFIVAALAAAWLPARRATEVNPITALRSE